MERKVTKSQRGRPVVDRLHLPPEHYQPGDTAEVQVDGATVTIKPKQPAKTQDGPQSPQLHAGDKAGV